MMFAEFITCLQRPPVLNKEPPCKVLSGTYVHYEKKLITSQIQVPAVCNKLQLSPLSAEIGTDNKSSDGSKRGTKDL